MDPKEQVSNETIERLKVLLGNFNSAINTKVDIYSLCIKKRLKEKSGE